MFLVGMGVVIHPQPTDFQSSVFLFGKHTMTLLFFLETMGYTAALLETHQDKQRQCAFATWNIL